jgi:hypothetical protein
MRIAFNCEQCGLLKGIKAKNVGVVGRKVVMVKDTGRPWLERTQWNRPGHKSNFTSWEKKGL